jgi:hypothetical protein
MHTLKPSISTNKTVASQQQNRLTSVKLHGLSSQKQCTKCIKISTRSCCLQKTHIGKILIPQNKQRLMESVYWIDVNRGSKSGFQVFTFRVQVRPVGFWHKYQHHWIASHGKDTPDSHL